MVWDGIPHCQSTESKCSTVRKAPGWPRTWASRSGEAARLQEFQALFLSHLFTTHGTRFLLFRMENQNSYKGKTKTPILCSWVTRHSSRPNCKSYKRQLCGVASPLWVVLRSTAPDINTWLSFNLASICFEIDENRDKEATCLKAE